MAERDRDEFYVGYLPKAPPGIASWVRKWVTLLFILIPLLGWLLVESQSPSPPAVFEFGKVRDFTGRIVAKPYPVLVVKRPGQTGAAPGLSRYFLVAFGKKGAGSMVAPWDGQWVTLAGSLVYRDDQTMIEVVDGSIRPAGETRQGISAGGREDLGKVTLLGEIVDSKCFLGVMNPGNLNPIPSSLI